MWIRKANGRFGEAETPRARGIRVVRYGKMRRCKLALEPPSSQPSSELDFGRWRCARTAHLQRRATLKPRRHTTRASPRVVINTRAREPTPSPPPRHLEHPETLKLSSSQPRSNFDFGRLRCAPTSKVGLTRVHLQRRAAWETRRHTTRACSCACSPARVLSTIRSPRCGRQREGDLGVVVTANEACAR